MSDVGVAMVLLILILLRRGATVDLATASGTTPLSVAARHGYDKL